MSEAQTTIRVCIPVALVLLAGLAAGEPPEAAKAHFGVGFTAMANNDLDTAVAEFKQAIGLDGNYLDARCFLATAYSLKGEKVLAAEQYREIMRLAPEGEQAVEAKAGLARLSTPRAAPDTTVGPHDEVFAIPDEDLLAPGAVVEPWKLILTEGWVFTPSDLAALVRAIDAKMPFRQRIQPGAAVRGFLFSSVRIEPLSTRSHLSFDDLVAAYGPPDNATQGPDGSYKYGPLTLYRCWSGNNVAADGIGMTWRLEAVLYYYLCGKWPPAYGLPSVPQCLALPVSPFTVASVPEPTVEDRWRGDWQAFVGHPVYRQLRGVVHWSGRITRVDGNNLRKLTLEMPRPKASLLQGSQHYETIDLTLKDAPAWSLFPGQTVHFRAKVASPAGNETTGGAQAPNGVGPAHSDSGYSVTLTEGVLE